MKTKEELITELVNDINALISEKIHDAKRDSEFRSGAYEERETLENTLKQLFNL